MASEVVAVVPVNKNDLLTKLRDQVKEYVTAEKLRLTAERTFLKSVLDNSLGGPEVKEKRYDDVVVIDSVTELIGVTRPANIS
ncbi:MAG: hypothetical protein CL582_09620 [Alteromonadaceae bacterium]|nr:hypothetical protein [Alteromonadaceae bacterium]|tara:strand:- start:29 stop:277 length:249 start_codon:yes stop_codon:yes gene_type:complete